MGTMKYNITVNDLQTRLAMRYLLLENFEIGRIDARHTTLDGLETTMTFDVRLKPGKWDKKYYHDPKE